MCVYLLNYLKKYSSSTLLISMICHINKAQIELWKNILKSCEIMELINKYIFSYVKK